MVQRNVLAGRECSVTRLGRLAGVPCQLSSLRAQSLGMLPAGWGRERSFGVCPEGKSSVTGKSKRMKFVLKKKKKNSSIAPRTLPSSC